MTDLTEELPLESEPPRRSRGRMVALAVASVAVLLGAGFAAINLFEVLLVKDALHVGPRGLQIGEAVDADLERDVRVAGAHHADRHPDAARLPAHALAEESRHERRDQGALEPELRACPRFRQKLFDGAMIIG